MRKKKFMSFVLAILAILSIISISACIKNYSSKPVKMVYYLRDGESRREVAEKFNVKIEDIKDDCRYLMFEVAK